MAERQQQPQSATGLTGQWLESQNPATQQRVTMAVIWYAQQVVTESNTTPNHQSRQRLSEQVVRNPQQFTQGFTIYACSQGFNSQGDDGLLRAYVEQGWNLFAGIEPQPIVESEPHANNP